MCNPRAWRQEAVAYTSLQVVITLQTGSETYMHADSGLYLTFFYKILLVLLKDAVSTFQTLKAKN